MYLLNTGSCGNDLLSTSSSSYSLPSTIDQTAGIKLKINLYRGISQSEFHEAISVEMFEIICDPVLSY